MAGKGNIGRVVLGRGKDPVLTVSILHEDLGAVAVLTLREARMVRDRMDEIIRELENDVPADEAAQTPTPRVRTRRRSRA